MTPKKTGMFFMVLAISLMAVQWVVWPVLYLADINPDSVIMQSSLYGIMTALFVIFIFVSGERPSEVLGFRKFKVSAFFLTILFSVLTYPALTLVAGISNLLFSNPLSDVGEEFPFAAIIIFTFVCAPVFEELAFRGIIFQGLRKSGRVAASIMLSAMAFGLFHGNLTQMIYTSILGIFAAFLMEAGGSIWLAMIYHLIFNFIGSVVQPWILLKLFNDGGEYSAEFSEPMAEPVSELAAISGLMILLVLLAVIIGVAVMGVFLSVFVLKGIKKVQGGRNFYPGRNSLQAEFNNKVISIPFVIGICLYVCEIVAIFVIK